MNYNSCSALLECERETERNKKKKKLKHLLFHLMKVVTLVLYTYFIAALIGEQMLPRDPSSPKSDKFDPDLYFPLFTVLKVS